MKLRQMSRSSIKIGFERLTNRLTIPFLNNDFSRRNVVPTVMPIDGTNMIQYEKLKLFTKMIIKF